MPPNVVILRGGAPVKNTILVNVDNETVFGDGSLENPLRSEGGGGAITTEHLEVTGTSSLDPDVTVSFVSYNGLVPESPSPLVLNLADGTTDGQQKEVLVTGANNIQYRITPASFADGSYVQFDADDNGGALFAWNATDGNWQLVSTYNGTVT